MTEKQEIRVKSAELAVSLLCSAGPFKPMPKAISEEEINLLSDCVKLFTDRIEKIILQSSD